MKRIFVIFLLSAVCFLSSLFTGCGGKPRPEGLPPTYPLAVKVLQEGVPLADATVSLVSLDAPIQWSVGGVTNADGVAKMWTYGTYDGAPEGSYSVVILKTVFEGLDEYDSAMARGEYSAARRIQVNMFQLVEDAYTSSRTTPIKVEVTKSTKTLEVDAGKAVRLPKEYLK